MPSRCRFVDLLSILVVALIAGSAVGRAEEIQFNRDVRPILSEYCFACHGFDAKKREADLRLDVPDNVFAPREGKTVITPGDLAQSELWQRIISTDPEQVMPPPAVKHPLSAAQQTILKQWIEQGAKYQKHWAFEAPVKPAAPTVKDSSWPRTEIDRFLLSRLEGEGLAPRKEAGKSVLIRRAAFALTGLPPTREEVALFEADPSPNAYENMVDRYLKSPRFGEEMARHWLDVARYADTHGLHLDNERTMWAYRDWVVGAFNDNLPFDQFTIEQLAGDLLPNPTREQFIATGFNRCNVTTGEGGTIPEEFLYRYAVERASTTMETWLGLTGGCAVCHDHKYDPISSKEFYAIYAFFYSAADPALDRNVRDTEPFLSIPTMDQKAALEQAKANEVSLRQQLEAFTDKLAAGEPPATAEKSRIEDLWLDDAFPPNARTSCSSRNASAWKSGAGIEPPLGRRALFQASASKYQDKFENPGIPLIIPESAVIEVWVKADPHEPPQTLMLEFSDGQTTRRALWGNAELLGSGEIGTPDRLRLGDMPPSGVWTLLKISAEQLSLPSGSEIKSVTLNQYGGIACWDGLRVVGDIQPATDPRTSFSAWWKSRVGKDTPGVPSELAAVLKDGPEKDPAPEPGSVEKLRRYFAAQILRPSDPEHVRLQEIWQDAQSARLVVEDTIPGTFVFKDLEKPRDAFVMLRGQYDKPGDKVEPAVPAIFSPIKTANPEARPTRLDLARWLVAPEHPLTARVAVNRFWQQFFGAGLVKTSFDFGSQGDPPSHPELLDWLAVTFQERNWDVKDFVRMLVTSAAFRQESQLEPAVYQRDPENRLLARGPRLRLDAEQIRDNVLYVSGLINLEMGGRGVNPYQPPNIWEPVGYSDSNTRFYLQDHGADLYRRSIYCFLKRTAPPPFMTNFDGPNREQFCTRRERTNTPLQALQLMNDIQHFEAARAFADRILAEGGTQPESRIEFAYLTVLSRKPDAEEAGTLRQTLEHYLARYRQNPEAARKAIHVGESSPKSVSDEPLLAAYTLLANLILNLDETINRN